MSIINTFPGNPGIVSTTKDGLMSKEDKIKLNGIALSANNYTHPETHDASIIVQDTNNRFVTDEQIAEWNSKASTAIATTSTNGLMSSNDKVNLNNLIDKTNNLESDLNNILNRISALEEEYNTILTKLKTAVFIQ